VVLTYLIHNTIIKVSTLGYLSYPKPNIRLLVFGRNGRRLPKRTRTQKEHLKKDTELVAMVEITVSFHGK
jgi:hypothetical protein